MVFAREESMSTRTKRWLAAMAMGMVVAFRIAAPVMSVQETKAELAWSKVRKADQP